MDYMLKEGYLDYTWNARGYTILFRDKAIGGAGISCDAPNPRGNQGKMNLKDNQRYAEITVANIISGKDKSYDTEIKGRINETDKI